MAFRAIVAGREGWAVVDNGAEASIIDLEFARAAGLAVDENRVGRLNTVNGTAMPARIVKDVPLALAGHFKTTLPFLVAADLGFISRDVGRKVIFVLGAEFFRGLALLALPNPPTLQLAPSGALFGRPNTPMVPLRNGRAQVEIMVDGKPLLVTIDLGFSGDLALSPEAWARVSPIDARRGVVRSGGADGSSLMVPVHRLPSAALGSYTFTNVVAQTRPESSKHGDGRLGMGMLGRIGMLLDVKAGKLWLLPPTSSADAGRPGTGSPSTSVSANGSPK